MGGEGRLPGPEQRGEERLPGDEGGEEWSPGTQETDGRLLCDGGRDEVRIIGSEV